MKKQIKNLSIRISPEHHANLNNYLKENKVTLQKYLYDLLLKDGKVMGVTKDEKKDI